MHIIRNASRLKAIAKKATANKYRTAEFGKNESFKEFKTNPRRGKGPIISEKITPSSKVVIRICMHTTPIDGRSNRMLLDSATSSASAFELEAGSSDVAIMTLAAQSRYTALLTK